MKYAISLVILLSALTYALLPAVADLSDTAKAQIAELDQEIKQKPSARLFAQRAARYDQNKMYREALADINRAIQAQPQVAIFHVKRAEILNHMSRFLEAIKESNTTMQLAKAGDDDFVDALAARADAYQGLGKFAEANKDLKRAKQFAHSR